MLKKEVNRKKRHFRIRKKISGTPECPRLSVYRSVMHFEAQLIDDVNEKTLVGMTTASKEFSSGSTKSVEAAQKLAGMFAAKMKEIGVEKIAFDRGGRIYHGRIKAFADGLRENGIKF